MKKNLISIIIPYHRKKKYFQQTINNILNQTYKNFEIIVIYDDYNKSDLEFVKNEIKKFKKKKLIINKSNLGAGLSRNKGIKYSNGDYIAFCDADDLWSFNKLEIQYKFMKSNNLTFSHSSYNIIDENGNKITYFNIKKKISYNDLIRSCDVGLSSVMCKKDILKRKFFLNTKTKEDYFLWLDLIKEIGSFHGINKKLSSWRKLDDSLSSSAFNGFYDAFKMYKAHTKKRIFLSLFYTFRLSINALIKKVRLYI